MGVVVRQKTHHHVIVIGTGFAGLGMAIRLLEHGMTDFIVLERAAEVGGTWRDNRYPGCACDVPANLYSFSFAPNPDWTRRYAGQPEIWEYLRRCADRFGQKLAVDHIRRQIADPELRRAVTPDYRLGCKRILLSDDYYPALTRPNV